MSDHRSSIGSVLGQLVVQVSQPGSLSPRLTTPPSRPSNSTATCLLDGEVRVLPLDILTRSPSKPFELHCRHMHGTTYFGYNSMNINSIFHQTKEVAIFFNSLMTVANQSSEPNKNDEIQMCARRWANSNTALDQFIELAAYTPLGGIYLHRN